MAVRRRAQLPRGHSIKSLRVSGEKHFVSLKLEVQSRVRARDPNFPSRQLEPLHQKTLELTYEVN